MTLAIETFSALKGGNSFFKAITHPASAERIGALMADLRAHRRVAIYDPLGFAAGFSACFDLGGLALCGVYAQSVAEIGCERLGRIVRPVTELSQDRPDLIFVAAFDAARLIDQIRLFIPADTAIVSLDAVRLADDRLANPRHYLDPLNFATNFAFFRDAGGHHTRVVTANYWSSYGASAPTLDLTLFAGDGTRLAQWREPMGPAGAGITLDSRAIRARFDLPEFCGQLFIHVIGAAGHDVVKYALDTEQDGPDDQSFSCTHDANAWPADFYAGLPAPDRDERVTLWLQNCLPFAIPAGAISLNLMGDDTPHPWPSPVAPYASVAIDVAHLMPGVRWPQQIEIKAGRHIVRPRYEVTAGTRTRIAHPNVERTDLAPDPAIAGLRPLLGKGFILPAPILPPALWHSTLLPTPMARAQAVLPLVARLYDPAGREIAHHRFGAIARRDSVALDLDDLIRDQAGLAFGHVELTYDFDADVAVDGWLHALFRYRLRANGHAAETSFGAHIFNTALTWRDEPQSYLGRPPGLSTRLFLRIGGRGDETLCHLIYPASTPWHPHSKTDLILHDQNGREIARTHVTIACGGSLFWRVSDYMSADQLSAAEGGYLVIRDSTCRLFGYHGLARGDRFSLDHMFGF